MSRPALWVILIIVGYPLLVIAGVLAVLVLVVLVTRSWWRDRHQRTAARRRQVRLYVMPVVVAVRLRPPD